MPRTIPQALMFCLLLPAHAFALGSFPGQIQSHLKLSATPRCSLCHDSAKGGGPIVTPFGKALLAEGLTVSGGSSLTNALDKLAQDGVDSNGDGVSDIDELKAGNSPNPDKTPPEYGCGGQIASQGYVGFHAPVIAAVITAFLMSRRSRPQRGSERSPRA